MEKTSKSNNSLIKRTRLIEMFKKHGIERFNKAALDALERKLEEEAGLFAERLARKLVLEGRKTLKEEDVLVLAKSEEVPRLEI